MLKDKRIVLGVTGSIAAYKAVDLASKLTQDGAEVDVIMTRAAQEFVTPISFRAITHRPVVTQMFDVASEFSVEHVALARRAQVVAVAPATANFMAKLAQGLADDMLSTTVLATQAPLVLAPAMDAGMFQHPATQENLARLKARGAVVVGPDYGRLASGEMGLGRLVDVPQIMGAICQALGRQGDLAGKKVVVSAGPTLEPLDPVRHIGNRSSGKMGYAIAEAARDRGAQVVLVSGPTALADPWGVEVIPVGTAQEMCQAVLQALPGATALIMAAAPADYRPQAMAPAKIKKSQPTLTLEMVRTIDILSQVPPGPVKVGFAAESHQVVENARLKLKEKGLDLIVANDVTTPGSGFATDTNRAILIDCRGQEVALPLMLKSELAHRILDRVVEFLAEKG